MQTTTSVSVFLIPCKNDITSFKYINVLCGHIVYVKTDWVDDFLENIHPKIFTRYILLTHNSDFSVGTKEHIKYLNDPKLLSWYGQNVASRYVIYSLRPP